MSEMELNRVGQKKSSLARYILHLRTRIEQVGGRKGAGRKAGAAGIALTMEWGEMSKKDGQDEVEWRRAHGE